MSAIGKLDDHNVPFVAKAWIHNEEILGLTREGNLIILAKIVGESEVSIFNPIPEKKTRAPRKPRPNAASDTHNSEAPETSEN